MYATSIPHTMLARAKNLLLDMLFPRTCLTCAKNIAVHNAHTLICDACMAAVPLYDAMHCPVCMRRIPEGGKPCHPEAKYTLAGATHYGNDTVQKLIWQMKYENWQSAGAPVGALLTNYLRAMPHDFTDYHVVPVPLHKNKEWRRGFNQAAVLGAHIATAFHLPTITKNLIRVKETPAQADQKDYALREKNIEGAFHVERPDEFKGKNIVLVDDVTTSGATLREAVRVLKSAGAKKILAAVVARAR